MGFLVDLLKVSPKKPLVPGGLLTLGCGQSGCKANPGARQQPEATVRTARLGPRRSLLTSRYPPWCWRHAGRPGPRRKAPGTASRRQGVSRSARPRARQDRITQAQGERRKPRPNPGYQGAEEGRAERTAKPGEGGTSGPPLPPEPRLPPERMRVPTQLRVGCGSPLPDDCFRLFSVPRGWLLVYVFY